MTNPLEPVSQPKRIVIATDLSARCDRALDRSTILAQQWQSELIAVNVLEPTATAHQTLAWIEGLGDAQLAQIAHKQLLRDMASMQVKPSVRIVRASDVATQINRVIEQEQAGLLVIAVAHNEALGRVLLGSTVNDLAHSVTVPMLVVRQRPHGRYRKIVVGTDLSEPSRRALTSAAALFPDQELVLYHAQASVMSGLGVNPETQASHISPDTQRACEAFLANTPLPQGVGVRLLVEGGFVKRTLPAKVIEHDVDLVVLGNKGAGGLKTLLLGSNTVQLLQWLPCDVLLVP